MTPDSLLIASPIAPTLELRRRRRCLGEPRLLGPSDDLHVDPLRPAWHQRPSAPRHRRARVDAVEPLAAVVCVITRDAHGSDRLVAIQRSAASPADARTC